jgi:hypothetical protein
MAKDLPAPLRDRNFFTRQSPFGVGKSMQTPLTIGPMGVEQPIDLTQPITINPNAMPAVPSANVALPPVPKADPSVYQIPPGTPPIKSSMKVTVETDEQMAKRKQAEAAAQAAQLAASIPMVEQSQTVSSSTYHDPKAVRQLEAARAEQVKTIEQAGTLGAAKAEEIRAYREQTAQHLKEEQARAANEQLVDENRLEMMHLEERKALDDLAKQKKDPQRFFKERGTMASIGAGIAVALGAFGAAMTGTRNTALDIINAAVERDLDAQEREIQIKRDKVNMQSNLIARFERMMGDRRQARSLARQHYLQDVAFQIESKAAPQPDEVKNNAKMNADALRANAAEEAEKRKQRNQQIVKGRQPLLGAAGGGEKQLPASEAEKLGTATAAVDANEDLYKSWEKDASSVWDWLMSFLPATDAAAYEDKRAMAKQVIGSYLEGGVLRKEDEAKYDRYLPEAIDSKARALKKKIELTKLIANRQKAQKKAMQGAGYNVSNIPNGAVDFTPKK